MNVAAPSVSPISPVTNGTFPTPANHEFQHDTVVHDVKSYVWKLAANCPNGSDGANADQRSNVPEYCTPPTMITFAAPVARTVFTSDCIPAAGYDTPEHDPPFFQHVHAAVVF